MLAREQVPPFATQRYSDALHWLDQALEDVLAGASPSEALAAAQGKAAAYGNCLDSNEGAADAWRTCAREADPGLALPSP